MTHWSQEEFLDAFKFAAIAHLGQTVPGSNFPYVAHFTLVTMEVIAALREEPGLDESLAVRCALLHDVLEDTQVTVEELERRFGPAVTSGVSALTKDATLPKEKRMADSLRRILLQPREIGMVKLADRITNLQPPPSHWSKEKIAGYLAEAQEIDEALGTASAFLHARLQLKMLSYSEFAR